MAISTSLLADIKKIADAAKLLDFDDPKDRRLVQVQFKLLAKAILEIDKQFKNLKYEISRRAGGS